MKGCYEALLIHTYIHYIHTLLYIPSDLRGSQWGSVFYGSSNIGKTTTTNQCRRVPDLWRPRSVKIKRYYTKNGRLIPTAKRGKEIKQP